MTVTGEVETISHNINGYVDLTNTASVSNNEVWCNIRIPNTYTLPANLKINGDCNLNSNVDLNNNTLEITGTTMAKDAVIAINHGKLICHSDLTLDTDSQKNTCLDMKYTDDKVTVYGDLLWKCRCPYESLLAGILELKGDFTQQYGQHWYVNEDNFKASGTHEVIFSGDTKQTISFSSPKSYFNIVEIQNQSLEGVYCSNGMTASEIITNGCRLTYNENELIGTVLERDDVINQSVILIGETLDLNGKTLTINGDFIHKAGTVDIHGGTLIGNGSYYMQSTAKNSSGDVIPTGYGSGILKMTTSNDTVRVSGNFVANSIKSHTSYLTNGTMEIGGNISQSSSDCRDNFNSMGEFILKLNGRTKQVINFGNADAFCMPSGLGLCRVLQRRR